MANRGCRVVLRCFVPRFLNKEDNTGLCVVGFVMSGHDKGLVVVKAQGRGGAL